MTPACPLATARAALEHKCLSGQLERARWVLLLLLSEGASPRLVERAIGRVARLRLALGMTTEVRS